MIANLNPILQMRLLAVLQAALQAPGNWPRFHQVGLIMVGREGVLQQLASDWPDRFTQLALLTKDAVRQNPGQFVAGVEDVVYRGSTSGSRGQAYCFLAGQGWNQQRIQSRQTFLDWWGIGPETPIMNLMSRLMPGRPGDCALGGQLTPDLLATLRNVLEQSPAALRGYPSRLCEVASYLPSSLPPIKAVICTGEPLFEHQRRLLETVFQAPVINEYGCHEAAVTGFSCPEAGHLHLDESRCFYEVIDHHLITTDLWNETMPLIRYQGGDLVHRYDTPCPCGRPGLTVEVLGRMEDRITTRWGLQPTGKVAMPPLPGILHYRLQRSSPLQCEAWVQTDPAVEFAVAKSSLQQWSHQIFGPVDLAITQVPPTLPPTPVPIAWSDRQWLETITQQSLGAWLTANAMPQGEAQAAATVLKTLLNPHLIGLGLPQVIQNQIARLTATAPATDDRIETIKQRILLLACSALDDDASAALYTQVLGRLSEQSSQSSPLSPTTQLDTLIPSLYLAPSLTHPAWQGVDLTTLWPLDPLNAHHLLTALDAAIQQRPTQRRSPMAQTLNPLLAVLVADLSFWAPQFTLAHLGHWIALLQGDAATPIDQPADTTACAASATNSESIGSDPSSSEVFGSNSSSFLVAWLQWRWQLLHHSTHTANAWQVLQQSATSATERERLLIERGYQQIVLGQSLDPKEWIPILRTQTGWDGMAPAAKPTNLTAWLPIIQALAKPLHQRGQRDLAYHCLVTAVFPSRQTSAFDRLTQQFNQKQSVLVDLSPWQEG